MAKALTIEDERLMQLGEERRADEETAEEEATATAAAAKSGRLSFAKKITSHGKILAVAAIFDVFALIPVISVFFNMLFGLILYLYFGGRSAKTSKTMAKANSGLSVQSDLLKIGLPIALGSCLDWFLSILPVNLGTALIRIALS